MLLEDLLGKMVALGASDVFAKVGSPVAVRVAGQISFLDTPPLDDAAVRALGERIAGRTLAGVTDLDMAVELPGLGRFRCNAYLQQGRPGLVLRHIKKAIPSFEELGLPAAPLKRLAALRRGLVLVTGIAGSGKSTTLAAIVSEINRTSAKHVVTIEDPIEYVFVEDRSIISQREIGLDTESFAAALRHAVRQSPDVILVGEMRDLVTIETAIAAAETGHLVLSTLHTVNAIQTVERMMTYFPPHQHGLIRLQLSLVLVGVIAQRLLPRRDRTGRIPAVELLLATPTIKEILYEGRTRDIAKALEEGSHYGTQTFNQALRRLVDAKLVAADDAIGAADDPDALKLALRGIS